MLRLLRAGKSEPCAESCMCARKRLGASDGSKRKATGASGTEMEFLASGGKNDEREEECTEKGEKHFN